MPQTANVQRKSKEASGDGDMSEGEGVQPSQVKLNLLYLNVNGINGKAEQLRDICSNEEVDVFLMTESLTKYSNDDPNDYSGSVKTIRGKHYIKCDNFGQAQNKVKGKNSGVTILVKKDLKDRHFKFCCPDSDIVEKVKPTQFEFTSVELVWEPADGIKVEVVCLCVYRFYVPDKEWPPTNLQGERFCCELEEMIEGVRKDCPGAHIILTGDFNINLGDLEDLEASIVLRGRLFQMGFLFKNRNNYKVGTYKSRDGVWRCYDFAGFSPPKAPGLHEIEITQVVFPIPKFRTCSKFDHRGFKLHLTIRPDLDLSPQD